MRSLVIRRPPPPPAFRMLANKRLEPRTITAVYEVTADHIIADVDGVRYRIANRLWGMIRDLELDQYVGIRLLPKQVHLHSWRYVPVRPAEDA